MALLDRQAAHRIVLGDREGLEPAFAGDPPQHRVGEGGAALVGQPPRLLDPFVDRGVVGDAVEEKQLVGGDAQRRAERRLDRRKRPLAGHRQHVVDAAAASAGCPAPARAGGRGPARRSARARCRGRRSTATRSRGCGRPPSRPAAHVGGAGALARRGSDARAPGWRWPRIGSGVYSSAMARRGRPRYGANGFTDGRGRSAQEKDALRWGFRRPAGRIFRRLRGARRARIRRR